MKYWKLKIQCFIMKKMCKHVPHLFLVTLFFQPHWLLCQSKGRSRKRGSSSELQPINYIHVLADTISVPIQSLHPLKAAFQDWIHHCGTTKAVPFQDSKCTLRFPKDTTNGFIVAQAIRKCIAHQWWLNLFWEKMPGYPVLFLRQLNKTLVQMLLPLISRSCHSSPP